MIEIGVNVNNREPLLTERYSVSDMLTMGERAEAAGYDAVWVGDSLLEKPRLDPVAVLGALAARTDRVALGTSCLVSSLRNPIQLAQQWASLDMLSGGRMVMGACMASTANRRGREQYEVVGLDPADRAAVFEEGLVVLKELLREGSVTFAGEHFAFEDVSFDTGAEAVPLAPVQEDPPVLVVSNPSSLGGEAVHPPAVRRIVEVGDGWMTCCRASHPDEYARQIAAIRDHATAVGVDPDAIDTSYQVTVHLGDSRDDAMASVEDYLAAYYPGGRGVDVDDWGPVGDADRVIDWIERFADLGCRRFVVRFAAVDQLGQLERFADEVLPAL